MSQDYIYILINFSYILIFGILTMAVMMLNMPKNEESLKNYRKSRYALGTATSIMTLYCIFRLIIPQHHGDFLDFWLMVTVTLLFSWVTYVSFLYLIETPRYCLKKFIADGIIPVGMMTLAGAAGILVTSMQQTLMMILGCVYGLKCSYMLYICIKEYRKCQREIENYYDEGPHMSWMYFTLILSFIMFISTLIAFYVPSFSPIYYITIPVIYIYLVFRVIGFATKKIDNIRRKDLLLEKEPKPEKKEKSRDLADKVKPLVDRWVQEKNFCKEGLNIKDVAMEMGTNHNSLSQFINNNLEMTFQIWLNTLRIEESKQILMSEEKLSIEEVGIKVGIPQNYNFSRWFKQLTNMTPFQYRREFLDGKKVIE